MSTSLQLERLSLGTAPLGDMNGVVPDAVARATIHRAIDLGLMRFDTAPRYGEGEAERHLGLGLAGTSLTRVSTKVGWILGTDGTRKVDITPAGLRRSLLGSLERLGIERVDIAFVHDPEHFPGSVADTVPLALENLQPLIGEGLIGSIGVGSASFEAHRVAAATGLASVGMVASHGHLLDSSLQTIAPQLQAAGIRVINAGVFATGLLASASPTEDATFGYQKVSNAHLDIARRLARLADEHGTDLPTVALHHAARIPGVDEIVVGAASPEEVTQLVQRFTAPCDEQMVAMVAAEATQMMTDYADRAAWAWTNRS